MEKTVDKTQIIRRIYAVAIGAFTVAIGIALICVAADIYYSGKVAGGVIFTREIVANRLTAFVIPFIILIGLIAVGVVFPLYEVRGKQGGEKTVSLLAKKIPSGSGEEYDAAAAKYKKLWQARLYMWAGVFAALLACTVAVLCYVLNTANFSGEDITKEIFRMVQHVLPWIAAAFVVLIGATVASGIISRKQVQAVKTLIKTGDGNVLPPREIKIFARIKQALSRDISLWIIRGVVFVVGVTFIILGIVNGGARDVLIKAINICTECIGLG